MLFVLEQSVDTALGEARGPNRLSHGLDLLAMVVSEGKHRLTAQRQILKSLSRNIVLTGLTRAVLQKALASVEIDLGLRGDLSVIAQVSADPKSTFGTSIFGNQRVVELPLDWIDDSLKVQSTILLGENLSDTKVLLRIVQVFKHLAYKQGLPISARTQHGGGMTVAQVLKELVEHQEFCLCIVDSDRKHPGGPVGETASRALRFNEPVKYSSVQVLATQGRDLENLLPNGFYREAYGHDANHSHTLKSLEMLSVRRDHEARAHLDLKRGLVLNDLFVKDAGEPRKFWENTFHIVGSACGKSLASFSCYHNEKCAFPAACTCRFLNGNGDNILERFEQVCAGFSAARLARLVDDSVRDEWLRLGKAVFDWCCSTEKLRS